LIKRIIFLFIILAGLTAFLTYKKSTPAKVHNKPYLDLDAIRKRGKLIAITDFNSTDYFIFRGEPMGFNYELLKSFSDYIGIDLEIIAENNIGRAFEMVRKGEADMLAFGLTDNSSSDKDILHTSPVYETREVLVQRKPRNWQKMTGDLIEKALIRRREDLAEKTIFVQENSARFRRPEQFGDSTGRKINVVEVPYESEKLIRNVADGVIEYTVCDENVAQVNSTYYEDIDVRTPVGSLKNLSWGVRKENSESLLRELNQWISAFRNSDSYLLLYAKYFRNSSSSAIMKSDYYSINTGKVSQYDDLIRKFSLKINWDWRLLASLICQESQFRSQAVSNSGAYGLMQIMPVTARNFRIDITSSPENNMKAGILYINWLYSIFDPKITDEHERLSFVLAAYNAGPGHVLDAMRLAEKNGMDPQKWDGNVAVWLLKKSERQYYRDTVVKSGYFRGTESVKFVSEILTRYEHYKNIIPQEKNHPF
jgi:membrane-bound lytic murein transglycosylase F